MSWEVVSCWIEGHPGLASWVQAFGSIAALGIAIWVASSQRSAQLKTADKIARDKVAALIAVVESASIFATILSVFIERKPSSFAFKESWKLVNKNWLESSLHSLSQLPAHELGKGDLVRGYFGILAGMTEIRRLVDSAINAEAFEEQEFFFMYQEVMSQIRIVQATWRSFQACASTKQ
ncbi:hypothetical protein J3P91_09445 [Pseudomonas sp. Z4-7]|uniref:hypothetical protein n=1 Tax=Pseudomonas sp. Z4-7 TaxID=2817413 RepID=UPI003DA8A392